MADEITVRLSMESTKSGSTHRFPSQEFDIDMAGDNPMDFRQDVGTSAEAVLVGDVGTGYMILAINLDSTNYVQLGYDSGGFVPFGKILAGEPWGPARIDPTITLQARANTASCNVRFIIYPA